MATPGQALIEVSPGMAGQVRTWFRGKGRPNNIVTLLRMRAMVRECLGLDGHAEDAELAEIADEILRGWGITSGDEHAINEAVYGFIFKNIGYVQDRAGGHERLQHPRETLRRRLGDCDDLETLAAALLGLCGIQSIYFEAAKYFEETDGADHVYGFAQVNSKRVTNTSGILYHDLTAAIVEGKPLGWYEENYLEYIRVPVFGNEEDIEASNLAGFWDGFKKVISFGWKLGATAAPFIPGLGPVLKTAYSAAGVEPLGSGSGGGSETRTIGGTFEQAADITVDYFDEVQKSGNPITIEHYNKAAAMLSELSDFVDKNPIAYVKQQWNSAAYKPVFEERLQQIKTAALANVASAGSGNGGANANGGAAQTGGELEVSENTQMLVGAGVLGLGLLLVLKVFRG